MTPSDRVRRILRSKSPFSADQIDGMTDAEGWAWIYAHKPAPKSTPAVPQVCFTGFLTAEKAELTRAAQAAGIRVVQSVTVGLSWLCAGSDPGPAKLAKAEERGKQVISREQFEHLLATGEVPGGAEAS